MSAVPEEYGPIRRVYEELNSGDIAALERQYQAEDRRYRLRTVIEVWQQQQEEERALRKVYANWIRIAVYIQIAYIDLMAILLGLGILRLDRWVAYSLIVTVFLEIVALATVIVRHLFPRLEGEFLNLIEKL